MCFQLRHKVKEVLLILDDILIVFFIAVIVPEEHIFAALMT